MPPINCPERDSLVRFLLGNGTYQEIEQVGQHLEQCDSCREIVDRLDKVRDPLLCELPLLEQPVTDQVVSGWIEGVLNNPDGDSPCTTRTAPPRNGDEDDDWDDIPNAPHGFELGNEIGRGGFGIVYSGLQEATGSPCVLKFPRRKHASDVRVQARFEREGIVAERLGHPNIVRFISRGETEDRKYLALEWIPGIALNEFVEQHRVLDLAETIRLAADALSALEYSHGREIVHRDISPKNLFRAYDGRCVVIDWGLASISDDAIQPHENPLETTSRRFWGTPAYASPEQLNNFHRCDIRTDIYSLGWTLINALTGLPPGDALFDLNYAILCQKGKPVPLLSVRPDIPMALVNILRKMIAHEPYARYQSPGEVLNDLLPLLAAPIHTSQVTSDSQIQNEFESFDREFERILKDAGDLAQTNSEVLHHETQLAAQAASRKIVQVLVVGPTGVGKSALIESFLQQHTIPSWISTEGVSIEYRYSPDIKFWLHLQGEEVRETTDLNYVAATLDSLDSRQKLFRVEVGAPSDFLTRGYTFVERRLNADGTKRPDEIDDWVNADVVLCLLSPELAASHSFRELCFRNLMHASHHSPIWVVTRTDRLRRPEENQRVKNFCRKHLLDESTLKSIDILFPLRQTETTSYDFHDLYEQLLTFGGPRRILLRRVRPLRMLQQAFAKFGEQSDLLTLSNRAQTLLERFESAHASNAGDVKV